MKDEDDYRIPLRPLEVETASWWGYLVGIAIVAILIFVVLHR